MFNPGLVRRLCQEIGNEKDPEKSKDLTYLLQVVIKGDQDEIRIRRALLAKKYAIVGDCKAAA